jgi:hypothetical protein
LDRALLVSIDFSTLALRSATPTCHLTKGSSHKASPAKNALFSHEDIFLSFKRSISLCARLTFFF